MRKVIRYEKLMCGEEKLILTEETGREQEKHAVMKPNAKKRRNKSRGVKGENLMYGSKCFPANVGLSVWADRNQRGI